jgi:hypothetical protein
VSVAQSAEGEGAAGDDEGGAVADLRVAAGEELCRVSLCYTTFSLGTDHDVANHHQGSTADEQDRASIDTPADERN